MTQVKVKTRPTGATAVLARMGQPDLTTPTGGTLGVTTSASDPGFNPIDLPLFIAGGLHGAERAASQRAARHSRQVRECDG